MERKRLHLSLLIKTQEGITWDTWLRVAKACESSQIERLFATDHYLSTAQSEEERMRHGSLDAWSVVSALASITRRTRLGTLVSPVTFRHPSLLAKMLTTVDHVSGGRVELGLGAGWWRPEHDAYGFEFPSTGIRFQRLAEQLIILHGLFDQESFSFGGRHYTLKACRLLPKPLQRPHPPIILGGRGGRQLLRLAVQWADEFNTFAATPKECGLRFHRLYRVAASLGRDPTSIRTSVTVGCIVGSDGSAFQKRVRHVMLRSGLDSMRIDDYINSLGDGWITGTVEDLANQLRAYAEAGAERIILEDPLADDIDIIGLISSIVPDL